MILGTVIPKLSTTFVSESVAFPESQAVDLARFLSKHHGVFHTLDEWHVMLS